MMSLGFHIGQILAEGLLESHVIWGLIWAQLCFH